MRAGSQPARRGRRRADRPRPAPDGQAGPPRGCDLLVEPRRTGGPWVPARSAASGGPARQGMSSRAFFGCPCRQPSVDATDDRLPTPSSARATHARHGVVEGRTARAPHVRGGLLAVVGRHRQGRHEEKVPWPAIWPAGSRIVDASSPLIEGEVSTRARSSRRPGQRGEKTGAAERGETSPRSRRVRPVTRPPSPRARRPRRAARCPGRASWAPVVAVLITSAPDPHHRAAKCANASDPLARQGGSSSGS